MLLVHNGTPKTENTNPEEPVTPEVPENEKTEGPKKKKPNAEELAKITTKIHNAVNGIGTKDNNLETVLDEVTKDNIVELADTYYKSFDSNMFENILDDLSGREYTQATKLLKNALLERLKGTENYKMALNFSKKIEDELRDIIRNDERIVNLLNNMVNLAQKAEA